HGREIFVFPILLEIIEQAAIEARKSEFVDQKSGVSARMTISLLENAVSNAERRGAILTEKQVIPRICDLFTALSAITGKIELVYEGEQEGIVNVAKGLLGKAVKHVFLNYFPEPYKSMKKHENYYEKVIGYFKGDRNVEIADDLSDAEYGERLDSVPGLARLSEMFLAKKIEGESLFSSVAREFILEGLHQNSLLSKDELENVRIYGDMLQSMFSGMREDEDEFL
ncbi:MAG: magnesium chelatase, partial [bacterium]